MLSQRLAPYLKPMLFIDALSCTAFAVLLLGAGPTVSHMFSLPQSWVFHGGWICAASACLAFWLATREVVPMGGVALIAAANVLWGLVSVGAVWLGWITPTPTGALLTVSQGVAVLLLGELEFFAARGQSQRNQCV